ncbi:unnamed protein product [Sympodiomycopsis kandeliae]
MSFQDNKSREIPVYPPARHSTSHSYANVGDENTASHTTAASSSHDHLTADSSRSDPNHKSDPWLVTWTHPSEPNQKPRPRDWPKSQKWILVSWCCFMEFGISFASSAYSAGSQEISQEFGVSETVSTLGLTTFVAGLGIGAVFLAPLSEKFGRNTVYWSSFFVFAIFQLPVALATNIGTVLASRFIAGFAGSVPLTVTSGSVGDVFRKDDSGFAVTLFAFCGTAGPAFGPLVSGWITLHKGWRWIFWVNFIVWMAVWAGTLVVLKESKESVLIQRKAQRIRKETKQDQWYAQEEVESRQAGYLSVFTQGLLKPMKLLVTEATIICMAIYNGYVYGLLYLYFEAYPLVFQDRHGFNSGQLGLAYIPIIIGTMIASVAHYWQNAFYLRRKKANNGIPVPEARLAWALFGGPIFAISLFWFAFTTYPNVHWAAPMLAGLPFGIGVMIIYMSAVSFVTDSYSTDGASALAGVSLVRSLMGAGFPVFARQMYNNLGYQYAGLLIALLAVVLSFMAPVFYMHGPQIRARSPHARHLDEQGVA